MSVTRSLSRVQSYLDEIERLNTAAELRGAIVAAKCMLHFAAVEAEAQIECGITDADYIDFLADQERDRRDAMADAVSAHWGHD